MDILKEIRLNDLKERGASFIREEEIKKDVCTGTIYYYFDKYDEEISSAEVTVRYFPRGGAEIVGPHPNSDEGYDKLMKYIEKISKEEYIKQRIVKRRLIACTFLALKVIMIVLLGKSIIDAVTTGDIEIWEKFIMELILLIVIDLEQQRSLRL